MCTGETLMLPALNKFIAAIHGATLLAQVIACQLRNLLVTFYMGHIR
jgi:hypothetical protein